MIRGSIGPWLTIGNAYQVLDVIGEGAYGVVISAVHRPSGTKVAIKKVAPFDHAMFALRTLRELKLLKYFAEEGVSENVSATTYSANMSVDNRSSPCLTSSNLSHTILSKRVSGRGAHTQNSTDGSVPCTGTARD